MKKRVFSLFLAMVCCLNMGLAEVGATEISAAQETAVIVDETETIVDDVVLEAADAEEEMMTESAGTAEEAAVFSVSTSAAAEEPALEVAEGELAEETEEETTEEEITEEETTEEPIEESKEGLIEEDGKLYFYEEGEPVTGLREVDNRLYYFQEDGSAYTGGLIKLTVSGKEYTYYFGEDGTAYTDGLCKTSVGGKTVYYYFQKNGRAYTGGLLKLQSNGNEYSYYFQADGTAFTNGYRSLKYRHAVDANGNIKSITDGKTYYYYFQKNGRAYTGGLLRFVHTNGKSYTFYFQADGTAFTGGYRSLRYRHTADAAGKITSITNSNTYYYYFQPNGHAYTGGLLRFVHTNGKKYTFYFQSDGAAFTGGYRSLKYRHTADAAGKITSITDGKTYYYYFQPNGHGYTNGLLRFTHTNGKKYDFYFQTDGSALCSTTKTVTERKEMVNGKVQTLSSGTSYKYSFDATGKGALVRNGWVNVDNVWKYYDGGTTALVSSNGMHNAWLKIKDKSSATRYYIVVDTTACETYIFNGSAGNWTPVKCWKCSPGAKSTPTIKGFFTVQAKGYSFSGPRDAAKMSYTCYYYTQISGNYLFHSVLYHYNTMNVKDSRLGLNLSHGCVRLAIENAKWIQDNVPVGSKIYIY